MKWEPHRWSRRSGPSCKEHKRTPWRWSGRRPPRRRPGGLPAFSGGAGIAGVGWCRRNRRCRRRRPGKLSAARAISRSTISSCFFTFFISKKRFRGGHRPPPRLPPADREKWTALSSGPWAIDSASQSLVTVRQVFPDGPAPKGQASSRHFGGEPFSRPAAAWPLPERY